MGNTWRKESGVWKKAIAIWHKVGGSWEPLKSAYQKVAGTWVNVFDSKVVVEISTNQTNLVLKDLFTSADWYSGKAKTVWIHGGVGIYQGPAFNAALVAQSGAEITTWGGTLTILNDGIIQGNGGAGNSGQGGDALYVGTMANTEKKVQIINYGIIRAGGGGGGRGGNGGAGYYYYTAQEGPYYAESGTEYGWSAPGGSGTAVIVWADATVTNSLNKDATSYVSGAYTYYRGTFVSASGSPIRNNYRVYRQYTATAYTSGGTYGNGGRGQGGDGSNQGGTGGSAGGTNAGTGGTGGTGGTFGQPGNTGFTGSSGNYTGGTAGAAGGPAGYAYKTLLYDIVVPGTILGRVA